MRFSALSNERFSELTRLLSTDWDPFALLIGAAPNPDDRLRGALKDLGGIAERSELTELLGYEPDVSEPVEGVEWTAVGSMWVATGIREDAADPGVERVRVLEDLIRRHPMDTGIKALTNAVKPELAHVSAVNGHSPP